MVIYFTSNKFNITHPHDKIRLKVILTKFVCKRVKKRGCNFKFYKSCPCSINNARIFDLDNNSFLT